MRQQLFNATGQLRGQPAQHVLDAAVWIVPIQLGRVPQTHHRSGALPRLKRTSEPANSHLLRPMVIGLIWFSTQLLSAGRSPPSMNPISAGQRFKL
jgi:hypothetical protein